jgi:hypothetical protein
VCAAQANGVEHATFIHSFGMCASGLESWPSAALSRRLYEAAHEQSALHTKAQAAIASSKVKARLAHIKSQPHPVNALMLAVGLQGYLKACADLGLFEQDSLCAMQLEAHMEEERARTAFIDQYRKGDPDALPWRT